MTIQVAPSLLAANFSNLQRDLRKIPNGDLLHFDVMDGQFVPNISMGIPILQAVSKAVDMPVDVHLMIQQPARYIHDFAKAGADHITIHVESAPTASLQEAFDLMEENEVSRGLALRPMTKADAIIPFIKNLDMVLVMTVEPGFGGQSFLHQQLETIRQVSALIQQLNPECQLQVDGGITATTAPLVKEAGATVLVSGSAIFGAEDPEEAIEIIRRS